MPTSMTRRAGVALVVALVVVIAGVVAALVHDDGTTRTVTLPNPTTAPTVATTARLTTSTSVSSTTSTTAKTLLPGSTTTVKPAGPATTTEPEVPTPEKAANGLWAAYRAGDQTAAQRFATQDVIDTLFSQPYAGPDATFQSCAPDGDLFQCRYVQGTTSTYDMTVQKDPKTGSFVVVVISITTSGPASSTTSTSTTVTPPSS